MNEFTLDISLDNEALYEGCRVHRYGAKRPRIDTTMFDGFETVKRNAERIFASQGFSPKDKGDMILLTGAMKSWATAAVTVVAIKFFRSGDIEDESGRKPLFRCDGDGTDKPCPDSD